jgi:hypothetical protein
MQRHSFDIISFLFGALFVGAGLSAVLFDNAFSRFDGRWVWPALLVVAGVAVLVTTWGRRAKGESGVEESPESPVR